MKRILGMSTALACLLGACVNNNSTSTVMGMFRPLSTAEAAWRGGNFEATRAAATSALELSPGDTRSRRLLVLSSAAIGRPREAIEAFATNTGIGRDEAVDEAMLWSHFRLGDIASAQRFAEARGLLGSPSVAEQIRIAQTHPMQVTLSDVVELPYSQDDLSPYMPGTAALLNGHRTVVRFDTGGSFVHMTRSQADRFGVAYAGCESSFAGLSRGEACYGVADLHMGPVQIENVPVTIHSDDAIPTEAIAEALGVEMGPIIGTNIFSNFLTTFDPQGQRMILSPRGNSEMRRRHEALIDRASPRVEIDFGRIGSHYLIARGRLGDDDAVFFVDSGLAAFNQDQGQAALLMSKSSARRMGLGMPETGRFAEITVPVGFEGALDAGTTALVVPERTWRGFGDWQGIRVDALISYGYLKNYAWTLDFESGVMVLQ